MGIALVVSLHAVLAVVVGLAGRRLNRGVLLLAALGPAAAIAYLVARTGDVVGGAVEEYHLTWVPGMDLTVDLRLDGFGLLFWWLIAGIGLLVMLYGNRYFGRRADLGRFASMLVLFAGAMLLLTAADNLLLVFVAWELTSITSYLLIGFQDDQAPARAAALQALLVTGTGGLALMAGFVLVAQAAGSYSLAEVLAAPPTGGAAAAGYALILLGAVTKSAQVPFHFWLPGAMAAPTPVSAYLHSATMVKAGVYLIARFAPALAPVVGWWSPVVITIGGATMLVGGYRALRSYDLKSLLAYGTVSQLGFLVILLGAGDPDLTHAGVALLLAHALFKAALFLTVGVVDHQAHTRDLRRLDGLRQRMPVTAWTATLAAASMAGIIPLFGFVAKEAALEASLHSELGGAAVTTVIVVGSILTMAYALRLLWGAFAAKRPDQLLPDSTVDPTEVARPSLAFELPAVVLVALTVLFGLWVAPADAFVGAAAAAIDSATAGMHLALWHGFGLPLLLSTVAIAGGIVFFTWPGIVERLGSATSRVLAAEEVYRKSLYGLNWLADRVTGVVQPGSLPYYAGVVFATVVLVPGIALLPALRLPDDLVLATNPVQLVVAALVIVAALGAALAGRRLAAVLLLGAVGYGVAVLFVIHGAPDLALTQFLIETLSLAIFVLVLRRLPARFDHVPWRFGQTLRIVLSVAVGLVVGAFALAAAASRQTAGPAAEFLARALPEGGGRNVVNVILVDFRGLDTFGEITVLVAAAIGIAALVRAPHDEEGEE